MIKTNSQGVLGRWPEEEKVVEWVKRDESIFDAAILARDQANLVPLTPRGFYEQTLQATPILNTNTPALDINSLHEAMYGIARQLGQVIGDPIPIHTETVDEDEDVEGADAAEDENADIDDDDDHVDDQPTTPLPACPMCRQLPRVLGGNILCQSLDCPNNFVHYQRAEWNQVVADYIAGAPIPPPF